MHSTLLVHKTGIMITHDYASNATADAIVAMDAEVIAASENIRSDMVVKAEAPFPLDLLGQLGDSNRGGSLINELKVELVKAAGMCRFIKTGFET